MTAFVSCLRSPPRADQRQALLVRQPHQLNRGLLLSRQLLSLLLRHITQCRCHQGTSPAGLRRRVRPETPTLLHSPELSDAAPAYVSRGGLRMGVRAARPISIPPPAARRVDRAPMSATSGAPSR